jgi:putative (di)nucleoside polyphosphate hydrolase
MAASILRGTRDPKDYRACAGVTLFNRKGQVFVGHRLDTEVEAWQMPQGGIDAGESPEQAALRELREETGVPEDAVQFLGALDDWLYYDLPEDLAKRLWRGRYKGQRQIWFAFLLVAGDDVINIETKVPEFRAWQWVELEALADLIVPFKREIYAQVAQSFIHHRPTR